MISVRLRVMRVRIAVVHHVGMGKAVDRVIAVSESKHGRWRHEAKRGEGREQDRKPEAEPGSERGQHGFIINPPTPIVGSQRAGRNPRGDRPYDPKIPTFTPAKLPDLIAFPLAAGVFYPFLLSLEIAALAGGALMSLYIVYMVFREPEPRQEQVILQ